MKSIVICGAVRTAIGRIWFAGGSVLANTKEGAVNRALVIDPKGECVNHYDKVHLIPLINKDRYLNMLFTDYFLRGNFNGQLTYKLL